jgi:CRISPR-associated protein Cmr5
MSAVHETKTLDQQRAKHAWDVIEKVLTLEEKKRKEFGIQVKKLPTRIMAAGLGQALAFLEAQQYAPLLRQALTDWLNHRRPVATGQESHLLVRLIEGNADFQRYATGECLAYLIWLVRFADAKELTKNAQG